MSFTSIIRHLALVVGSVGALVQGGPTTGQSAYDGFNPPALNNGIATNVAVQADDKVLVAGYFQLGNNNIARLFPDGSHDTTFDAQDFSFSDRVLDLVVRSDGSVLVAGDRSGSNDGVVALLNSDGSSVFHRLGMANRAVHSIIDQPGGKFLIAGEFTSVDGQPRPRIARLKADGSLDESYDPSAGADAAITQLLPQPDGKVVVAGEFTTIGGQPRVRIARLNADGSLDTGFDLQAGTNDSIAALALQPDGKVLIAGAFTAVGHSARNRIARLNADGSVDETFRPATGPNAAVNDIVLLPDGGLVIAGNFLAVDGEPRNRIARLHPDGRLDDRFPPNSAATRDMPHTAGVNSPILGLALQQDGKVVLVGSFNEVDGMPRSGIARLNADGSLDADLEIGPGMVILGWNGGGSASGSITATTIQPDGKYLVGGRFNEGHGVPRKGIARFNADGTLDLGFDPGTGPYFAVGDTDASDVRSVALQPDRKILVGGIFTSFDEVPRPGLVRLESDGTLDDGFAPALYPSEESDIPRVTHVVVLPDGKTIVAGWIQTEATGGHRKVVRLLPDGSIDPSFVPYDFSATNSWVNAVEVVALQRDGKLLLSIVASDTEAVHLRYMLRLNTDGSLDPDFNLDLDLTANGEYGGIAQVLPQPDGKIILTGAFSVIHGQQRISVARLNADSSLDLDFTTHVTPGTPVLSAALQSDGALLIGGSPDYIVDDTLTGKVARLFGDGPLDRRFDFKPPAGPVAAGGASHLSIDASGKALLGGSFMWEYPGTQCCDSIARVQTRRSALQSLSLDDDRARVEWLRSGVGPEFSRVSLEVSVDGATWVSFGEGAPLLCDDGDCGIQPLVGSSGSHRNASHFRASTPRSPILSALRHVVSALGTGTSTEKKVKSETTPRGSTGISKVLISQLYTTEGSIAGSFRYEFIELFNAGDAPQDLTGWSVQYSNATSASWAIAALTGVTLQPGQYYLIQGRGTSSGSDLPTPDAISTIPFLNPSGKVALVSTTTPLDGLCPIDASVRSLIGYGSGPSCYEEAGFASVLSDRTQSALRNSGGCADAYNNATDFAVVSPPIPRNTASPPNPCAAPIGNGIEAIGGTPQSAPANLPFPAPLTMRVTDSNGNPARGVAVAFDVPGSGASASLSGSSARTNGVGEVAIAATANAETGSYAVSARAAGAAAMADFALSNTVEGSPASIVAISGTPQSAATSQAFAVPLTVRVVDANGVPVVAVPIRFATPPSGPRALLSATTVATNGNGEASVTARANRDAGSYEVTATVVGVAIPAGFSLTNTDDPGGSVVVSQIFTTGGAYGGGDGGPPAPYTHSFIELFNAGTSPKSLEGWSVQYSRATMTTWSGVQLTNVTLQPGQYYLVQLLSGGPNGAALPTPDVSGDLNLLVTGGKVALVNGAAALVGVCPIDSELLIDFVGYGSTTACAESAPVAVAPRLYNAEAVLRSGDGCLDADNNAADFHIGAPLPRNSESPISVCGRDSIQLVGGTPQSATVYGQFASPLTVRVTNIEGDPVSGSVVNFSPPSIGAGAGLSAGAVTTDVNGEASVSATANAIPGNYSVTASSPGVAGSIAFELVNTAAVLVAVGGEQQTAVNEPFHMPLKVRLSDGDGAPIENIQVRFDVPESGPSTVLSAIDGTTDENGEVSIAASANAIAGSYVVTATAVGADAPATFVLTNLAAADVAWAGWFFDDLNLPRNRNVWIRARGFTVEGSIHESTRVFYPTGGYTVTPMPGDHGRIEPAIPQGGDAGATLSFTIAADEGYGIDSVTGCNGSLNGSTYMTGPLSGDCEIVAAFAGDVVTHTVTSSAGPGGTIEPDGSQAVVDGQTISFVLVPDDGYEVASVDGTCGGELLADVFTTLPVTVDCTVHANFEVVLPVDTIFANGFEANP